MDKEKLINKLLTMLTYRRRGGSSGEEAFIDRFIRTVDGINTDGYGNLWIKIGDNPNVMFSCHTDSVHHHSLCYDGESHVDLKFQTVEVDETKSYAFAGSNAECLGADDAVGCFIMLEMIQAKVSGLYIFHREEEIGGHGSTYVANAEEWEERLKPIKQAIAFDRAGCSEVITAQGSKCCSNTYAQALADLLNVGNTNSKQYAPSDRGIFTDTANYTHVIPECTNIGCGYYDEHTRNECVVFSEVLHLLSRCLDIKWQYLPIVRDPVNDALYGNGLPWDGRDYDYGSASTVVQLIYAMGVSELADFVEYFGITDENMIDYYSYRVHIGANSPLDAVQDIW